MTKDFTKIAGDLLIGIRDLCDWGIQGGHTSPEQLRHAVIRHNPKLRREVAQKLIEGGLSQRQAAKLIGVSEATVRNDFADSAKKLRTRDAKEAAIKAKNAALKLVKADLLTERYGTIVIDPPWEMEKIKRDVRPNQVAFDYPTMTADELIKFPVAAMAADDCHLFCWTTQKHVPAALSVIEQWGFKYVLLMTWHKPGGFQPHGLPQYNSEFVIYGRRGAPKFRETQAFNTCFQGERRQHSRKPDEFYNTIRRVTPDGRLDVFSREAREGFAQYGNELRKFGFGT
jgi:N6-adenosine-specific RNA methylase IME4/DNA-binding CsgD family transcriptional regulator